jgi:transposase
MPKAYDNDLCRKVIEAIELNGMKRCEASEYFGISRNIPLLSLSEITK